MNHTFATRLNAHRERITAAFATLQETLNATINAILDVSS